MMKSRSGGGANCKVERKTAEKYRRLHVKSLCVKLASIIPKEHRTIAFCTPYTIEHECDELLSLLFCRLFGSRIGLEASSVYERLKYLIN
ncbi:hypothetical protein GW17_00043320 [Ensete ventricosum]|nr:hypothetical protein GW17_00043320 [Ensete ventricosum]